MSIRVLLADDHAMMRDGLQALLQLATDIEVVGSAGNGREALNMAGELNPDVVVMDITMPDMNGIEALGLLLEKHPQIRVVMLSMHSSSEHVYRALNAGAAGYLLKESAGEEIVTAVRRVHAGRSYMSPVLDALKHTAARSDHDNAPLASLSSRERQVLQLVVEGRSSSEIAALLHLSPKSVDTYRSRLMKKLGVGDLPALVKFAVQHGLTPPG